MQRVLTVLATLGLILFFTSIAMAAQGRLSISTLPEKGTVTLSGTVQQVDNAREFTLRDRTGTITVRMAPDESMVLKPGDNVTVTGAVEQPLWGLLGKGIGASNVEVHKDLSSSLADAVAETTGISMDSAKTEPIDTVPDHGMVKLTGTVDKIDDKKDFTLKDKTGSIDVSIQSDENVMLARGARVTVVGYVSDNMLGKKLHATRVIVLADAGTESPSAK